MNSRALELPLKGFGAQATAAEVKVWELDLRDRVRRAGLALGFFWLAALVALPIPVVHFVAVPAALLLGVAIGGLRFRQREVFRRIEGRCPLCGQHQRFEAAGRFRLPKTLYCGSCRRELQLTT